MEDVLKEFIQFAEDTFKMAGYENFQLKLKEEVKELENAEYFNGIEEEIVDCIFCLIMMARRKGISIDDLRYRMGSKLDILKNRKWEFIGGIYKHIK